MNVLLTLTQYIEFPKLGWHLPIGDELVHFTLFGQTFSIKWYGVCIAVGFLLAVIYGLSRAKDFGLNPDKMIDAVLVCTLLAFVGARLYYVLFSDQRAEYFSDPKTIFYIWEGGLGIYGGVIVAFLSGLLMCRLCKLNTLAMFDLASLGFLIGQACGRWGNFFNQEAFGGNTTLPWGMTGDSIQQGLKGSGFDPSLPVHPTFLYESLWCLLGFVLLHILSKKAYKFKGEIFCGYLVWYGAGRFMIESLRTDSLMLGTMRVSQLVAVLAVLGGVVLFFLLRRRSLSLPVDLADGGGTLDMDEATDEATEETADEATEETDEETADEAADEATEETTEETDEATEETDEEISGGTGGETTDKEESDDGYAD